MLLTKTRFMKKLFQSLIVFISVTILLYSCSSSNFSKQKFTDFKKGDTREIITYGTLKSDKKIAGNNLKTNSVTKKEINPISNQTSNIKKTQSPFNEKRSNTSENRNVPTNLIGKKNADSSFSRNVNTKTKEQKSSDDMVLLIILAILLPPLAVYMVAGIGTSFWINLILTLCFYLPGIIHALIVVTRGGSSRGGRH